MLKMLIYLTDKEIFIIFALVKHKQYHYEKRIKISEMRFILK